MTNKFNENLIGFVKKQLPESIVSKYEELYNLYANEQVQFRSSVHTLGMHFENILEEMFENAYKIMKLKHTMMVENLSEKIIYEELKQDIALLNLELIDAKKDIDQSKIMKTYAVSVKLSDVLISLAQTFIQSGNNPEIDKNSVHDFSTLFKIKENEINFYKSHLGKIMLVSNDNQTIN